MAPGRERRAAVEHTDVVEPEETTFEHVSTGGILAVEPPREVDEELLERALQPGDATGAPVPPFRRVKEKRGVGVHRRVHVAEVPLIGGELSARMEVELVEHQLEL